MALDFAWADALEVSVGVAPAFFVEAPDGRRTWAEIDRQANFLKLMRQLAPRVYVRPQANAGKRNPARARKEGIVAGVFDMLVSFQHPLHAEIEFKGYDSRGRAGSLSDEQIRHGNRMMALGYPVACFFDPVSALDWLRERGFPIRAARAA